MCTHIIYVCVFVCVIFLWLMNNKTKLIGKRVEQIQTGSFDIIMCIYLFIENSQTTKYKTEQKIQIAYINIITEYPPMFV